MTERKVMKTLSVPVFAIWIALLIFTQPAGAQDRDTAGAITGHHLYNLWGDDLGKIECVKSDDFGRPAFMILSTTDNKAISIPLSSLVSDNSLNYLVVHITRDQFHNLSSSSRNDVKAVCPLG
jgi:hypothetical protein